MKSRTVVIILALCASVFIGCTSGKENDFENNNAHSSEEGTYETEESQASTETEINTESQETEQQPNTEIETESTFPPEMDIPVQAYIEEANKIPDEELTLMQKVLLNKIEYNDGHKIEEIKYIFSQNCKYTYFYVVDLDHDGVNEVSVVYSPGFVTIFHEANGGIFGYEYAFRSMNPLYEDGTFRGSGGASISYFYGEVSFEGDVFSRETITSIYFDADGGQHFYKGNPSILTVQPGIEISEEEYEEIMSNYSQEEAEEYEFTIENILKYVE